MCTLDLPILEIKSGKSVVICFLIDSILVLPGSLSFDYLTVGLRVRVQETNLYLTVGGGHPPRLGFLLDSRTNCYFELKFEECLAYE